jgi:hypothetical protein
MGAGSARAHVRKGVDCAKHTRRAQDVDVEVGDRKRGHQHPDPVREPEPHVLEQRERLHEPAKQQTHKHH